MFHKSLLLSWRRNRRSPAWWSTVLLLGASSGAAVAIAVAYRAIVKEPLPSSRAAEIVAFGGLAFGGGISDPVAWWEKAEGLESISLYRVGDVTLECHGIAGRWVRLAEVSGAFFEIFQDTVVDGRSIGRQDERRGDPVAVVSAGLWSEISGGRGATGAVECRLGNLPFTVVGVISPRMTFPSNAQVWIPRAQAEARRPVTVDGAEGLAPVRSKTGWIGLPRPGVTVAQLKDQMGVLLRAANDELSAKTGIRYGDMVSASLLVPGLTAAIRPAMILLLVSTLFVFVLSLGSGVVLSVVRASDRQRDVAVRLSLGASSTDIAGEVLAESVVLALAALFISLVATAGSLVLARHFLHGYRAYLPDPQVLWRPAVSFALIGSIVLVAGSAVPTWIIARKATLLALLRSDGPDSGGRRGARVVRRGFVALSGAVATVLLAGALVADRSLAELLNRDLGYRPDGVVVASVALQRSTLAGPAFRTKRGELMIAAEQAGLHDPAVGSGTAIRSTDRGFLQVDSPDRRVMVAATQVDGSHFELLKLPVRGPGFSGGRDEIILNESAASDQGLAVRGIGTEVHFSGSDVPKRVVGIVPDTRTVDQDRPVFEVYRPFDDVDVTEMPTGSVLVQVAGRCAADCRTEVGRLFDNLKSIVGVKVARIEKLTVSIADARGNTTVAASIWTLYGALTIGIAIVAVLAMTNHSVARRRREVAIRSALGASPRRVMLMFMTETAMAIAAGVGVGVTATFYSTTAIQKFARGIELPGIRDLSAAAACVLIVALLVAAARTAVVARQSVATLLKGSDTD